MVPDLERRLGVQSQGPWTLKSDRSGVVMRECGAVRERVLQASSSRCENGSWVDTEGMKAAEFDPLFQRLVARPLAEKGFEPWGKSLFFQQDGLRAALMRSELRSTWPFAFTLLVSHDCLRDFDGRMPAPKSRVVNEWPIKMNPLDAPSLLGKWTYRPYNLNHGPKLEMRDGLVPEQLAEITRSIQATFPAVIPKLTPSVMLAQLREHGDILKDGQQAWCERQWIEDYRAASK